MNLSRFVELKLSDPGWRRIDDATIRVVGDVDAVIAEMQQILDNDTVQTLCRNLGICSSGFLFYDKPGDKTSFFNRADQQHPQTYRTHYLWKNQNATQLWVDLVHWLFVRVRIDQYKQADLAKVRTEDYFVHLPIDDTELTRIPSGGISLRKELNIHYCTLGEMLFTMLLWRCLSAASSSGKGSLSIGSLNIQMQDRSGNPKKCIWQQSDLLLEPNSDGNAKTPELLEELRSIWGRLIGPQTCWQKEWQLLGIQKHEENGSRSFERDALIRFASEIGVFDNFENAVTLSDMEVNLAVQRSVGLFLGLLGVTTVPQTIDEALGAIEKHARFPILPFYTWQVLDQSPKCYFVSPAWTSQHHAVEVWKNRHCRHLGLAVSAVSPMLQLDWTIPRLQSDQNPNYFSNSDPVVIVNVLRLMAKPLVEGRVYHTLSKEMEKILNEKAEERVQKEIKKAMRKPKLSINKKRS